jgi:hypothetical protein
MYEGGGGLSILLIVVAVAAWFWQGDPARDVRRMLGQQTYEDQEASLADFAQRNRIGDGQDVWLVKTTYVRSKVALFFGYYDDWAACYEFQALYVQRYPADTYVCEYAN